MCEGEIRKTGESSGGMEKKGGYQPLNEGYTPLANRGYTPSGAQANSGPPKAPQGGSGQSSGGSGQGGDSAKK